MMIKTLTSKLQNKAKKRMLSLWMMNTPAEQKICDINTFQGFDEPGIQFFKLKSKLVKTLKFGEPRMQFFVESQIFDSCSVNARPRILEMCGCESTRRAHVCIPDGAVPLSDWV